MLMQIKKIQTDMSMHHPQSTAWRNTPIKKSCHLLFVVMIRVKAIFACNGNHCHLKNHAQKSWNSSVLITELNPSLQGNGELKLKT